MKTDEKTKALSQFLEIDEGEAESLIDDEDYSVLTDEEADEAAKEYILDSLWAFNASFLAYETDLPEEAFIKLSELCEGANYAILAMIDKTCGIDEFVDAAISAEGRGHFISSYDGEENEITVERETYYIYRLN